MSGPVNAAREAWGVPMPDWIEVLAEACAESSQNKVAKRLGRSSTLVSQVLRRNYTGDMKAVEDRVRGVLMSSIRNCPAMGEIALNVCQDWQERSRVFSSANSARVLMYRACRVCVHNRRKDDDDE